MFKKICTFRLVFVFLLVSVSFVHLVEGNETCNVMQEYGPFLRLSSFASAQGPDQISLLRTIHIYWVWIVHLFIVIVLLALYAIYVHRYNKLLKKEVSERRSMEHKLQQYAGELKHSNEMKDLFADILRHDLLNPAGVISGYTDLLREIETELVS